jgi:flagellar capping protein FliD
VAISLNTNNVATDAQGRTTFSGVSSGINAKQIVDSVIKAREVRTDKLSAEIKTNEDKIAAYNALTQKTAEVRNSLKELYGRITADKSANVFDRKSLSASTSKRSALVNETVNTKVSAATDLLSATAANTTATGSHEIEILQIAAAHSLRAMFGGGGALGLSGTIKIRAEDMLDTKSTSSATVAAEIAAKINDDTELSDRLAASVTATELVVTGSSAGDDFDFTLRNMAGSPIPLVPSGITAAGSSTAKVVRYSLASLAATAPVKSESGGNIVLDFDAITCVAGEVYGFRLDDGVETSFSVTARAGADAAAVRANVLADLAKQINDWSKSGDPAAVSGNTVTIDKAQSGLAAANISVLTQYRFGLGHSFEVASSDTLGDLRARISASNEGTPPSGLTASSVSVSATQTMLMVSTARTNRFVTVEMPSSMTTTVISSPSDANTVSLKLEGASADQTLELTDVELPASADMDELAANLQAALRLYDRGGGLDSISVVVSGGALQISDALGRTVSGFELKMSNGDSVATADSLVAGLATAASQGPAEAKMIVDGTVLRRDENTVADAIGGITIRLIQAEPQTRVRIGVEQDLAAAQSQIGTFVAAYNDLVQFINQQSQIDPATGTLLPESVLARSSSLRSLRSLLDTIRTGSVGYGGKSIALKEVGVQVAASSSYADIKRGQLEIDQNAMTSALLNSPDKVRRLFQFSFTSTSANLTAVSFSDKTQAAAGTYTLRFSGGVPRIELGGTSYALTKSGNLFTVAAGPAEGLSFLYTGGISDTDSAGFTLQPGLASRLYYAADSYAKTEDGLLAKEVTQLSDQITRRRSKIDELRLRFERERENLMARYLRMETTLGRLGSLRETLQQYADSMKPKA